MKILLKFIKAKDIKQIKKDVISGESIHTINKRY